MAWIKTVDESEADGLLARIYEGARQRAGQVHQIIKVQSNHAPALKGMIDLYSAVMRLDSPLSRAQREMMAVVVSRANGCHY